MTSVAIDTSAARQARPAPPVRVVRGGRHGLNKARQIFAAVGWVLSGALLLGLLVSILFSQAKITELNGQINDARTELTAAQSDYDYYSSKMNDIASRTNVEEVAEGELGLVKADPSQITYVQLEDRSVIETSGGFAADLLADVHAAALSLLDGLDP